MELKSESEVQEILQAVEGASFIVSRREGTRAAAQSGRRLLRLARCSRKQPAS